MSLWNHKRFSLDTTLCFLVILAAIRALARGSEENDLSIRPVMTTFWWTQSSQDQFHYEQPWTFNRHHYHSSIMHHPFTWQQCSSFSLVIYVLWLLSATPWQNIALELHDDETLWEAILHCRSCCHKRYPPETHLNTNFAKSRLLITSCSVLKSLWNFAQNTAVLLPCSV